MRDLFICPLTVLSLAYGSILSGQPTIQWQLALGGSDWEVASSIVQTSDGGYVIAGYTSSTDGDVSGNHGINDYWVVRLDAGASVLWKKCFGGTGGDWARSIQQTVDGGFILAGQASSQDGDISAGHGGDDYWLVKLDEDGTIEWEKSLGGSGSDQAASIQQTTDGGYIVAGNSTSNDGDVSGHHGLTAYPDYWVVKLDATGMIQWERSLGGSTTDRGLSVRQVNDGGFVVAGYSDSNDGDVSGNHGVEDYWVLKLDNAGDLVWQRSLGGSALDWGSAVYELVDGGCVVTGWTVSNDGDVSGNHGNWDYWVVKLDIDGNTQWKHCFGGGGGENAAAVQRTTDGGIIVAGATTSNNGDVSGNNGSGDYWLAKLDASGDLEWQKCLGGSGAEYAHAVQQTSDGGFVVAGYAFSSDGDLTTNQGGADYWVVKLNPYEVGMHELNDTSLSLLPNPASTMVSLMIPANAQLVRSKVLDATGRAVPTSLSAYTQGRLDIDVQHLAGGTYLLEILLADGTLSVERFVKE